jgi:hypothetical protein
LGREHAIEADARDHFHFAERRHEFFRRGPPEAACEFGQDLLFRARAHRDDVAVYAISMAGSSTRSSGSHAGPPTVSRGARRVSATCIASNGLMEVTGQSLPAARRAPARVMEPIG